MIRLKDVAGRFAAMTALCLCFSVLGADFAGAQSVAERKSFQIPAQPLDAAVMAYGRQAGLSVAPSPSQFVGRTSQPLTGMYSEAEALDRLLAGSGLTYEIDRETRSVKIAGPQRGSAVVAPPAVAPLAVRPKPPEVVAEELTVTGTRIRGAAPASPVIQLSQRQMLDAGQGTLAEALRAIPQNFNGGQNPGIAISVPESRGVALGGAYGINLRGLGPDATLTLLNGHRLSYNMVSQSVDASAIPFGSVERIEIVADGASALYGSDAVAGVANIVLRRDFDGFATTARFGASTDGGNLQQQYSAVGGTRWETGGMIASVEAGRDTPILSSQRDYAGNAPGLWLYPYLRHQSALVSGHQQLSPDLTFEFDALYNRRRNASEFATDSRGFYLLSGSRSLSGSNALGLAPTLKLALGDWRTSVTGSYGFDRSRYDASSFSNGNRVARNVGCYCNQAANAEWNADGPVLRCRAAMPRSPSAPATAPADSMRTGPQVRHRTSRRTRIPITDSVKPACRLCRRKIGSDWSTGCSSARHCATKRSPMSAQVAAPKLGVVYAPVADVELKASWGKSFHAPALYQLYNSQIVNLRTAQSVGGTGYPATATALQLTGGNPDLRPERATAWTASTEWRPARLEGARFELSYFNVRYRDRIAVPISSSVQSLANPAYADLVTRSPSAAQQASLIAGASLLQNLLATPYDPSTVVAIVNNSNQNIARQSISGIDLSAEYRIELGGGDAVTLNGSASYLQSSQRLNPQFDTQAVAGTVYNPPHLRARAGAVWNAGAVTLAGYANYIGGSRDVRQTTEYRVGATTTVDLHAGYRAEDAVPALRDTEIAVSVQNLLNQKPPVIRTTQVYEPPYDSTNYNAFGRFVSIRLTRKW